MSFVSALDFSLRQRLRPSSLGTRISVTTILGFNSCARASATKPSSLNSTLKPACSRKKRSSRCTIGLRSTTRIRALCSGLLETGGFGMGDDMPLGQILYSVGDGLMAKLYPMQMNVDKP